MERFIIFDEEDMERLNGGLEVVLRTNLGEVITFMTEEGYKNYKMKDGES